MREGFVVGAMNIQNFALVYLSKAKWMYQTVQHGSMDGSVGVLVAPLLWILGVKRCTDIPSPQRINPNDFDDPLTFPLAPPTG